MSSNPEVVLVNYTNWKGITSLRRIVPLHIFFGCNEWHDGEQWLLQAFDVDKGVERTFALKDIHSWTAVSTDVSCSAGDREGGVAHTLLGSRGRSGHRLAPVCW